MSIASKRDKYLQLKYGITQAVYEIMLQVNDGKCWICDRPPKPSKNLHVDHAHKTKQVRGLLCWQCNRRLIGRHTVNTAWIFDRAAVYLRSTKDWRVDI